MENLAKYMKSLENSRNGVVSNIVIDAIKCHIQSYTGDVDWEEVEERLEANTLGWLIDNQDLMEFYAKNWVEVDTIINQDDPTKSILEVMQESNAFSVIEAIGAVCYRAHDIVLSNIINQLKAL